MYKQQEKRKEKRKRLLRTQSGCPRMSTHTALPPYLPTLARSPSPHASLALGTARLSPSA
ncbi:hypothetical protein BDZ91DRAFT_727950 [Kalaharituber pfeilii]|nr:hypothetical protein BDZ91DRAFT_727950 [Kalaharituber pfeilii]